MVMCPHFRLHLQFPNTEGKVILGLVLFVVKFEPNL